MESSHKVGKFGDYYCCGPLISDARWMKLYPRDLSLVKTDDGDIFIKASALAAFCTELIEMARVLGVTGGQDGT